MTRFVDHYYGQSFDPPGAGYLSVLGCLIEWKYPGSDVVAVFVYTRETQFHNCVRFILPKEHPTTEQLHDLLAGFDPEERTYPDMVYLRHASIITASRPDTAQTIPAESAPTAPPPAQPE
jgi:hypothetical protein